MTQQPQNQIKKGPERKYPRKTFASGEEGAPDIVLNELLEIPNYLDYSVFSKNQLRFAEKVFKTQAYLKNENHIRGKNMFLKLNKPQYWNLTNIYLLFDSIHIVLDIVNEIIVDAVKTKINSNSLMNEMGSTIVYLCNSITNYFIELRKQLKNTNNLFTTLTQYTDPNTILKYFLNSSNDEVQGPKILAMGVVLATYAKVVSILTYVNPYVLVRKDSGVDTIKAPRILYDAVSYPEGQRTYNGKSVYENFEPNKENFKYDEEVKDVQLKSLNVHVTKLTGERNSKTKTYSKNPLIRLKQYPMYSLDIIYPIKIAPYIITKLDNFKKFYQNIIPHIIPIKLICSVLKISFDGVLSKFHTIESDNTRIKASYALTSKNNDKKLTVTLHRTKNKVNTEYMGEVLNYSPNRPYFEGKLHWINENQWNIKITKLSASGTIDSDADTEATNKQIKKNLNFRDTIEREMIFTEPDHLQYKETSSPVVSKKEVPVKQETPVKQEEQDEYEDIIMKK